MSTLTQSNAFLRASSKVKKRYHKLAMRGIQRVLNEFGVKRAPDPVDLLMMKNHKTGAAMYKVDGSDRRIDVPASYCLDEGDDNYTHLYNATVELVGENFTLDDGDRLPFVRRLRVNGKIYNGVGKPKKDPEPIHKSGIMAVYIAVEAIPHFVGLTEDFTTSKVFDDLKSFYAIRGHELHSRFLDTGWWEVGINELNPALNIQGKWDEKKNQWVGEYSHWGSFIKSVINPMQAELNGINPATSQPYLSEQNNQGIKANELPQGMVQKLAKPTAFIYDYIKAPGSKRIIGLRFQYPLSPAINKPKSAASLTQSLKLFWSRSTENGAGMVSLLPILAEIVRFTLNIKL